MPLLLAYVSRMKLPTASVAWGLLPLIASGCFSSKGLPVDQSVTTPEDTPVEIDLGPSAVGGYELLDPPQHGALAEAGEGRVRFTPDADWNGVERFTWAPAGAGADGPSAMVTIDITPVNDAPVATAGVVDVRADAATTFDLPVTDVDGDALTCSLGTVAPSHGDVTVAGCAATFTPDIGYTGPDTLTFRASDGSLESAEVELTLSVGTGGSGDNHPPTADNHYVDAQEDVAIDIPLVATDPDGDPITWTLLTDAASGRVVVDGDVATYTPDPDYSGRDLFQVLATDSHGAPSDPIDVVVDVSGLNDPPVALGQTLDGAEDTTSIVPLLWEDPDLRDEWTFTIVAPPDNGEASIDGSDLVYIPDPEWSGTDRIRFTVTDGAGLTSTAATVTIAVGAINDPPVASDVTLAGWQDTPLAVALVATDVEGAPLTASLAGAPAHGSVSVSGMEALYTPEPGWYGTDTFTWTVSDGAATDTGVVTIEVAFVDSSVEMDGGSLVLDEDTVASTPLTAVSENGSDVFTYAVASAPLHGEVSIAGDVATYTPAPDYFGDDSFLLTATDGTGARSAPARFTVVVDPVPDAPTAASTTVTVQEDVPLTFSLPGSDPDGDALTFVPVSPPTVGEASWSGGQVTYTPAAEWSGTDSLSWYVSDGTSTTEVAITTLDVVPVNDPPTVADLAYSADEDQEIEATLTGTDVEDGTDLTYSVVDRPVNGTVYVEGGLARFVPDVEWSGVDSFTYVATDSEGGRSEEATVTVTYAAVNDAPTPTTTEMTVDENRSGTITLTATDPEGDPLTYGIAIQATNGRVGLSGTTARYTPDADFDGTDTFTYSVSDGVSIARGQVTVTVINTNGSPDVTGTSATGLEDTDLVFTLQASDPDGGPLTFAVSSTPANGTVTLGKDGEVTYTPNADWNGTDTFRWRATDVDGLTATANAYITIEAVNDAPVASDHSVSTDEDEPLTFRLPASDIDARGALTYTIIDPPDHAGYNQAGSSLTFNPDDDWYGVDTLTYVATDGELTSNVATVTISVNSVEDAPRLFGSAVQTAHETPVPYVSEVSDPDSETITFVLESTPSYGTLVETEAGWEYTPDPGYTGRDRFRYYATDGVNASDVVETVFVVHPPTLFDRPRMPQIGLNKVQYGLGATIPDVLSSAPEPFQPDTILDTFHELGVQMQRQITRQDLMWSEVQAGPNNFIDATDNEVVRDLEVEPSVTLFELQYASPTPPNCTNPDNFQKELGDEARAYLDYIVENYTGLVTSYELGNEMFHWVAADPEDPHVEDLPACYPADGYSPAEQAVFLEAAGEYLKEGNPDAVISLASINSDSTNSREWMTEVITNVGDTEWFDVVTFHAYDTWGRSYNTRDDLAELLESLGIEDKLLRLTEMGTTSDKEYTERTNYPNSTATQCSDIFRLPLIAWSVGTASALWHTYLPISEAGTGQFQGFEILEYDGSWKAAAYTYQLLTTELVPVRQVTEYSHADRYVYRVLTDFDTERWVMWGDRPYPVPEGMTEYTSVVPNEDGTFTWLPVPEDGAMPLTDVPVLLR